MCIFLCRVCICIYIMSYLYVRMYVHWNVCIIMYVCMYVCKRVRTYVYMWYVFLGIDYVVRLYVRMCVICI